MADSGDLTSMTDLSWQLARRGYDGIAADRESRGGGDDYVSRLLGRRTVVVRSREGARLFYDESLVRRGDAVPLPLKALLFGKGAVHGLDGQAHRDRKLMLVDVLGADRLGPLVDDVALRLRSHLSGWAGDQVSVFCELVTVYGGAVMSWAGIPTSGQEPDLSRRLARIVDGFGAADPAAYARAWQARLGSDRWATRLVDQVRRGELEPPAGSPLSRIAAADGLDSHTAGVELLNVLRPTVAVSWLGAFAAVRLAEEPGRRARLGRGSDPADRLAFAQEVRRTSPFVPALAGRATRSTDVLRVPVRSGDRLVLDVIGIHTDPDRWPEPDRFDPSRFSGRLPGAFDLVPQGGGHPSGHRCPGESLTLRLLSATVEVLADVDYRLVGDTSVDRSRIPTLPGDGPLLGAVRPDPAVSSGRAGSV
jgi:fatty-acid peroxygenase